MTVYVDTPPTPWPAPGPCDLARAFDALEAGVLRLEGALVAGRVLQELQLDDVRLAVGPVIARAYEHHAQSVSVPFVGERRRATLRRMLDETRDALVRLDRSFAAELEAGSFEPERELPTSTKLCVTCARPLVLRFDQVVAARAWGIGFHFENGEHGDLLARAILRDAVRRFASDLSDLNRILERIRDDSRFPPLLPPPHVRAFERLMIDVLNEHRFAATHAPLEQDYSQKTDLRYDTERGLGRQRGARVQVTGITDFAMHDEKLELIENKDKIVLLSPIELARWIDAEVHGRGPFHVGVGGEILAELWKSIGPCADVRELVNALARVFQRAPRGAVDDPLGPLVTIPVPVRELVRTWVDRSALRSTRLLRAYEDRFGQDSARGDGRMRRRFAPPPHTPIEDWNAFTNAHRSGAILRARVERVTDGGTWMSTAGGVDVFVLTRKARPEQPSVGEEAEIVLLDASEDRRWFTAVFPGEDPELVLHREKSPSFASGRQPPRGASHAAWDAPAVRALEPGARVAGKIVHGLHYGVLVELLPGVLGLLHTSQMGDRRVAELEVGTELDVVVVRLHREELRIELRL